MAYNTKAWAQAKIRLGWLLDCVLEKNAKLFANEPSRMHAFEASLFMIGYDVRCLLEGGAAERPRTGHKPRRRKAGKWSCARAAGLVKTSKTLRRGVQFEYVIDDDEVSIAYSKAQTLSIPQDELDGLIELMRNREYQLGADRDNLNTNDMSIGAWLLREQLGSRQHASRLAAVLVKEYPIQVVGTNPLSFKANASDADISTN